MNSLTLRSNSKSLKMLKLIVLKSYSILKCRKLNFFKPNQKFLRF